MSGSRLLLRCEYDAADQGATASRSDVKWCPVHLPLHANSYNRALTFSVGPAEDRARSAFDDRALYKVRMFNHQRDDLVLPKLILA